ncbi:MAG: hypothetical protein NTW29_21770 [Bacteroidetes bacterium]|nr:hypothetical protein [Bacteroidota bacterium]
MPSFSLTLINEKKRFYDRFAVFMFVINAAAIIVFFFARGRKMLSDVTGGITLLLLVIALLVYINSPRTTKRKYYFLFATFFTALYWLLLGYWWVGSLTIVLAALYLIAQQKPEVTVTEEHIRYPAFPPARFSWTQLNNIILKDGLLTIDLKNNRLIQQTVDEKISSVNEPIFNEFCQQQLQAHKG